MAEPAREFFYLKDRRKQDAALHEPILAEGDNKTAHAISRKVAKRLGLSDAQIDALMKPRPELMRTKEWDETKHPRDPGGKFSESGDGGGGGDKASVTGVIAGPLFVGDKPPSVPQLVKEKDKFIYHSSVAGNLQSLQDDFISPRHGSWIEEVAAGAGDMTAQEVLQNAPPLSYFSEKPDWVVSMVARQVGKPHAEVTDQDIIEHGHVALIPRVAPDEGEADQIDQQLKNIWHVPDGLSDGPYSKVTNLLGETMTASAAGLYDNGEPFGVESGDIVSTDTVEPMFHLVGKDLLQFIKETGNRKPFESRRMKEWDESKHPRDPGGKFAESGGSGGASAGEINPEIPQMLLVSERPNQEKLDRWREELDQRQNELAAQGQAGNAEDSQINGMLTALGKYMQEPDESLDKEGAGLNVVYDGDGHLRGAAFTYVDTASNVAKIANFGALDHAAGLKTLQQVINKFASKVDRIESETWADDKATIAIFEAAGYKVSKESGGQVTLVKGELPGGGVSRHTQHVMKLARDVAKDLGFDPDNVLVSKNTDVPPEVVFREVNGRKFTAAGVAYTGSGPNSGKIQLFTEQLSAGGGKFEDDQIKGVTAHEVEHIKYQTALNKYREESKLVMTEPPPPPDPNSEFYAGRIGGPSAIMKPDGTLYPPYDKKFPVYQAMEEALYNVGWSKFKDSDGVSNYSADYWKELKAKNDANLYHSSMHETLAEMGRIKYMTGKFPEHMGDPDKKATKAQMAEYAKLWRDLYRTVEKIYQGKIGASK